MTRGPTAIRRLLRSQTDRSELLSSLLGCGTAEIPRTGASNSDQEANRESSSQRSTEPATTPFSRLFRRRVGGFDAEEEAIPARGGEAPGVEDRVVGAGQPVEKQHPHDRGQRREDQRVSDP